MKTLFISMLLMIVSSVAWADGKSILFEDLPTKVQTTLNQKFEDAEFGDILKVTELGQSVYKINFYTDEKEGVVTFNSQGQQISLVNSTSDEDDFDDDVEYEDPEEY